MNWLIIPILILAIVDLVASLIKLRGNFNTELQQQPAVAKLLETMLSSIQNLSDTQISMPDWLPRLSDFILANLRSDELDRENIADVADVGVAADL